MQTRAPEIISSQDIVNADRVALSDLVHKKTALVFFWNGSGVSSLRALRAVGLLHEKYASLGLEVIGVHTPEFEFEEDRSYVERIAGDAHVKFPIVLDNDYENWLSYKNQYWPRLYVVNVEGVIVHDQIGEVGWRETERRIRDCLSERALLCGEGSPFGHESFAAQSDSPVDFQHSVRFGVRGGSRGDFPEVDLVGDWKISRECVESRLTGDKVILRGAFRDLYLVAEAFGRGRFGITLNSSHPGRFAGDHLDGGSFFSGSLGGVFRILKNLPEGLHEVECVAESPGLRLYRAVVE